MNPPEPLTPANPPASDDLRDPSGLASKATPVVHEYIVGYGDSVNLLALRTGVSAHHLRQLNPGLGYGPLRAGQLLRLPTTPPTETQPDPLTRASSSPRAATTPPFGGTTASLASDTVCSVSGMVHWVHFSELGEVTAILGGSLQIVGQALVFRPGQPATATRTYPLSLLCLIDLERVSSRRPTPPLPTTYQPGQHMALHLLFRSQAPLPQPPTPPQPAPATPAQGLGPPTCSAPEDMATPIGRNSASATAIAQASPGAWTHVVFDLPITSVNALICALQRAAGANLSPDGSPLPQWLAGASPDTLSLTARAIPLLRTLPGVAALALDIDCPWLTDVGPEGALIQASTSTLSDSSRTLSPTRPGLGRRAPSPPPVLKVHGTPVDSTASEPTHSQLLCGAEDVPARTQLGASSAGPTFFAKVSALLTTSGPPNPSPQPAQHQPPSQPSAAVAAAPSPPTTPAKKPGLLSHFSNVSRHLWSRTSPFQRRAGAVSASVPSRGWTMQRPFRLLTLGIPTATSPTTGSPLSSPPTSPATPDTSGRSAHYSPRTRCLQHLFFAHALPSRTYELQNGVPAACPSQILSTPQRAALATLLPDRIRTRDWYRVYSTQAHGRTFQLLIRRMAQLRHAANAPPGSIGARSDAPGRGSSSATSAAPAPSMAIGLASSGPSGPEPMPHLLVIRTTAGTIVGGFATHAWVHPGPRPIVAGTAETFLFTFRTIAPTDLGRADQAASSRLFGHREPEELARFQDQCASAKRAWYRRMSVMATEAQPHTQLPQFTRRTLPVSAEVVDAIDPDALIPVEAVAFHAVPQPNAPQIIDTHGFGMGSRPMPGSSPKLGTERVAGLWINLDLENVQSVPCADYANLALLPRGSYSASISTIECWAFGSFFADKFVLER